MMMMMMMMAQGLSTPDPSLSPIHLSIRRGRATTTHYTHHQVSLMVSRNTTLVPSLGLRIGLLHASAEAGLSAGMRRERVPPRIRKKRKKKRPVIETSWVVSYGGKTIPRWRTAAILKIDISPYVSEKFDFGEILYTAADFELDERHVIKNEKVALDRLRIRQNVGLFLVHVTFKLDRCTPDVHEKIVWMWSRF